MWICPRCNAENREANVACESCGAVRSVGRFGSAPPRRPSSAPSPRISAAPARDTRETRSPREQEFTPSAVRNEYAMPDMDARPKPVRRPTAALAKGVGTLLCALLPALIAVLAWRQYDALLTVVTGLFLIEDGPSWLVTGCYVLFSLIAGMIALLPGLWTLLLARIVRQRR